MLIHCSTNRDNTGIYFHRIYAYANKTEPNGFENMNAKCLQCTDHNNDNDNNNSNRV